MFLTKFVSLFFISRSSSFFVIQVSVDSKFSRKNDPALLLFFLSKSAGGEDDHNMDLCHQLKHRLQTTHRVKKVISLWVPCGVDGRAYGHVAAKMSRMHR